MSELIFLQMNIDDVVPSDLMAGPLNEITGFANTSDEMKLAKRTWIWLHCASRSTLPKFQIYFCLSALSIKPMPLLHIDFTSLHCLSLRGEKLGDYVCLSGHLMNSLLVLNHVMDFGGSCQRTLMFALCSLCYRRHTKAQNLISPLYCVFN